MPARGVTGAASSSPAAAAAAAAPAAADRGVWLPSLSLTLPSCKLPAKDCTSLLVLLSPPSLSVDASVSVYMPRLRLVEFGFGVMTACVLERRVKA